MPAPLKQTYRFLPAATWNCGIDRLSSLNGNTVLRRYSWQPAAVGLDVPISVYDAAANASYCYDSDANKNISELTDSSGTVVAHYEYSPFGMQTKATCTYASSNPFRFSSEYFDAETGLVYYNYRYYDAKLGRWLSRDPIGEIGGFNLYMLIHNNAVINVDNKGLSRGKLTLKNLGDMISDPYPSCLSDGFFRHCWNTCVATKIAGPFWANFLAMLNGGDFPWQEHADPGDVVANIIGTMHAFDNYFGSCEEQCLKSFHDMVKALCCPTNKLIFKKDKRCCDNN